MNLRICIVTMTPELAYDAVNHAIDHAKGSVSVMIAANCCDIDEKRIHPCAGVLVHRFDQNAGVVPAMHALWEDARNSYGDAEHDLLAYIHDDCQILQWGWDEIVKTMFLANGPMDAIGFVGGTGIGADNIYQVPYQTIQLGRHDVRSNMVDAEAHGSRSTSALRLATADGCALVLRRTFLDAHGGWSSWWPEANHGYDNALACLLRRHGKQLWLAPIVFRHPSQVKLSGRFANGEAAQQFTEKFGTDLEVHTRAHKRLYDEFRDVLPFKV